MRSETDANNPTTSAAPKTSNPTSSSITINTSTTSDKSKKREKSRPRKTRKSDPKLALPHLTIQNIEADGDVIHCQLETSKQSTVSFKFSKDVDLPDDIANNLVCFDS